ncbi:hypothetical protein, partial [Planktosalinus lacus]|uniref:hypothetical protein n=1 Tax=Planktosalinus lacus TaxID=1526573 RepID=UPI00166D61BB
VTCISTALEVTINAVPDVPAEPTADVVQPTCAIPMGTITITSPLGSGYEYSINGTDYQAGLVFEELASGTYEVTVRNSDDTTCVSTATVVEIDPVPATPEAPEVSVTQPTCAEPFGSITILSPLGDFEYSINGTDYQAGLVFEELASGTYEVTVRNSDDTTCVSTATEVEIDPVPATPEAPEVSVTQPTCAEPFGSITIVSPLGDFEYSINGTDYQAGLVFEELASGTYEVTVRNSDDTTCVSTATEVEIDPAPATPEAPEVSVTQPTCAEPFGSITIVSPLGDFEYSINGTDYQA